MALTRALAGCLITLGSIMPMNANSSDHYPPLSAEQREAIRRIKERGGLIFYDAQCNHGVAEIALGDGFSDADLPLLEPFRGYPLYGLNFGPSRLSVQGFHTLLGQFPSLKSLKLGGDCYDDAYCRTIGQLKGLQSLSLRSKSIRSATLAQVGNLKRLLELDSGETSIDDQGLANLEELSKLKWLCLSDTTVTGYGLRSLANLTNLDTLLLHNTLVDDDGLKWLAGLNKLRSLRLDGTQIKGPGLAHLKALENLEDICLDNTDVREDALIHLRDLPKLRDLSTEGSQISEERRYLFKMSLPANWYRVKPFLRELIEKESEEHQREWDAMHGNDRSR